jgi:thiol-disulfide isomerase/thioredoxin
MKISLVMHFSQLTFGAALAVAAPVTPAVTADQEWAALQALAHEQAPTVPTPRQTFEWDQQHYRSLASTALTFYRAHPSDPRRWSAAWLFVGARPEFVQEAKWTDENRYWPSTLVRDELALACRDALTEELIARVERATDLPPDMAETMATREVGRKLGRFDGPTDKPTVIDFPDVRATLQRDLAIYPNSPRQNMSVLNYMRAFERAFPEQIGEEWGRFVDSPHAGIATLAREKVRFHQMAKKLFDLSFTAVDGREVNLVQLHGKVVLLDFWATWCGPCKEEIPNVKKVYAAYHDRGFEVIGISLENANLTPKDTPEQTAAKLEKAKKVLTDFTAANDMPWPQYFDGKHWRNDVSTRFAVDAIPAMLLLDQNGKAVSTNARGEALEREVKRLLKL